MKSITLLISIFLFCACSDEMPSDYHGIPLPSDSIIIEDLDALSYTQLEFESNMNLSQISEFYSELDYATCKVSERDGYNHWVECRFKKSEIEYAKLDGTKKENSSELNFLLEFHPCKKQIADGVDTSNWIKEDAPSQEGLTLDMLQGTWYAKDVGCPGNPFKSKLRYEITNNQLLIVDETTIEVRLELVDDKVYLHRTGLHSQIPPQIFRVIKLTELELILVVPGLFPFPTLVYYFHR